MIEALLDFDPVIAPYSHEGVTNIRVIVYHAVPVMAMIRYATHASDGKANLHQGAVGVGIDIGSGRPVAAVQQGRLVTHHPDTNARFTELKIPHWQKILELAAGCAEMYKLGYLGADIVLDRALGPMLLELNARPGLSIQVANQEGLIGRLKKPTPLPIAATTITNPSPPPWRLSAWIAWCRWPSRQRRCSTL